MRFSLLLLAAVALLAASCERIPPSVSIPGYGGKNTGHGADEARAGSAPAKHGG